MSTPRSRANCLRGALVGGCAALVTIGAHTVAGASPPRGAALIVALLVCTAVGAAVSGMPLQGRRTRVLSVVLALCTSQALGHLTLMAAGGHQHVPGLGLTPTMLAAHVAAAVVLGVAIAAVEHLYLVSASVLRWLRLFAATAPRPARRAVRLWFKAVAVQSVLLSSGLGMRAPPSGVETAS